MKQLLLILALMGQSVLAADKKLKIVPNSPRAQARIEGQIRLAANKRTGKLTKAHFEKVTYFFLKECKLTDLSPLTVLTQLKFLQLNYNQITDISPLAKLTKLRSLTLNGNQLTDVKGLEKLTQLTQLELYNNPALTKAQIAELQKALPKCEIQSNPKK